MTLDPFLLEILVCPETKSPVKPLSPESVQTLNNLIREGKVKNRAGCTIAETVDTGLLRTDGKVLYPVRSDIPVMLVDEGLLVEGLQLSQ